MRDGSRAPCSTKTANFITTKLLGPDTFCSVGFRAPTGEVGWPRALSATISAVLLSDPSQKIPVPRIGVPASNQYGCADFQLARLPRRPETCKKTVKTVRNAQNWILVVVVVVFCFPIFRILPAIKTVLAEALHLELVQIKEPRYSLWI